MCPQQKCIIGGPAQPPAKIIHETDNSVINNQSSITQISQGSTDPRRRQFSDLSPMPSFQSMPPLAKEYHILECIILDSAIERTLQISRVMFS